MHLALKKIKTALLVVIKILYDQGGELELGAYEGRK